MLRKRIEALAVAVGQKRTEVQAAIEARRAVVAEVEQLKQVRGEGWG